MRLCCEGERGGSALWGGVPEYTCAVCMTGAEKGRLLG